MCIVNLYLCIVTRDNVTGLLPEMNRKHLTIVCLLTFFFFKGLCPHFKSNSPYSLVNRSPPVYFRFLNPFTVLPTINIHALVNLPPALASVEDNVTESLMAKMNR